ncbi:unnamed protein product [Cyprideis torosa]|uniref:Uncharacterized protein n=1 Tax=Cyprideis torosa TaxID=163714 RepID=A0A7R8ZWZ2_9CRUS|nr:unnamed protein product [Cyprideis torosa]CAG0905859.1 unnamed protein product [Cyprideis torosa]
MVEETATDTKSNPWVVPEIEEETATDTKSNPWVVPEIEENDGPTLSGRTWYNVNELLLNWGSVNTWCTPPKPWMTRDGRSPRQRDSTRDAFFIHTGPPGAMCTDVYSVTIPLNHPMVVLLIVMTAFYYYLSTYISYLAGYFWYHFFWDERTRRRTEKDSAAR